LLEKLHREFETKTANLSEVCKNLEELSKKRADLDEKLKSYLALEEKKRSIEVLLAKQQATVENTQSQLEQWIEAGERLKTISRRLKEQDFSNQERAALTTIEEQINLLGYDSTYYQELLAENERLGDIEEKKRTLEKRMLRLNHWSVN